MTEQSQSGNNVKNTNWTIEQTMDMLQVPEEKRDKYRKTIGQNN